MREREEHAPYYCSPLLFQRHALHRETIQLTLQAWLLRSDSLGAVEEGCRLSGNAAFLLAPCLAVQL